MMRLTTLSTFQSTMAILVTFCVAEFAAAHCEVPCGIYDDQARFQRMLEDTKTIAKAIDSIRELSSDPGPQEINQLARWITTKEEHATNTQHIAAQYFLTQRIKAENPQYVEQLKAAHGVMVAAMKCKQQASPATADALKEAIYTLYTAYTGKQPDIHSHQ